MPSEPRDIRLKRLAMRSWRRGTKEMDLILGPFADACLAAMDAEELAEYEALLAENDQDLYPWITGAQPAPPRHARLLDRIRTHSLSRRAGAGGNVS